MASANWNNPPKSSQQSKNNNNRRRSGNNNNNHNNNNSNRSFLNDKVKNVIDQYTNSNSYYESSLIDDYDSPNSLQFDYLSLNESKQNTSNSSIYRHNNNNNSNKSYKKNQGNTTNNSIKSVYVTAKEIDEKYTCGVCHTILDSPHSPNACRHT